ncbi:MAG TPA: PLD nuclease N-terminal domain-containing protein [Acidimicrobiia bacterium]|nr:PLD nuclease N-terminal domain-containing protein [Acidimicrobiia bacterium]
MFFEAEGVVFLLLFAFWIWALFDCIATDGALCRNLPKGIWLILVLVLPDIGALAWLLLGRPEHARWRPGSTDSSSSRRPLGVEDSPGFGARPDAPVSDRRSAELDRVLEQWEAEQRAVTARDEPRELPAPAPAGGPTPSDERSDLNVWEAELDRREEELRRRELSLRERELDQRRRELDQG